jgi:diguanylate cyclase (GGDEF)-like protein
LAAVEEIIVLGLLGGIGQLALATVYPDDFGTLLGGEQTGDLQELYRQEIEHFGFEQAELSAAILADMQFPPLFQRLVHDYPQPENSRVTEGSREWKLLNTLHLGALIAEVCLAGPHERTVLLQRLRTDAARFAVDQQVLVEVADECARDWPEWVALLNMGARKLPSFAELFAQDDEVPEEVQVPHWPHAKHDYKMRVLVVEDDRVMRALLVKMLEVAGHQVTIAGDGVEALQSIEKVRPQLIVTDWMMPKMNGLELCRELRSHEQNRNVHVIVVTSQESPDKLVEAFEAGADDYLLKPLTPKIFFARLRAAQRVIQLQEELNFDREQLLRFAKDLTEANESLQRQALTDALTGLPNRRFAMERLEQEWALAQRGDRVLSCLMIDLDHFKSINDKHGHQFGDEALKLVATTLRRAARTQDVVCRYGGEEFVVICPDTLLSDARQCAERLRLNLAAEGLPLPDGSLLRMTASIGVAQKQTDTPTLESLLIRADNNLYAAKAAGRNCTMG